MNCPERDELAGFVSGSLSSERVDSVASHVEECPVCEETVRSLETSADGLLGQLRLAPPADSFADESGCQHVLEMINAIGREPTFTQGGAPPVRADETGVDLGRVRVYRLLAKLG